MGAIRETALREHGRAPLRREDDRVHRLVEWNGADHPFFRDSVHVIAAYVLLLDRNLRCATSLRLLYLHRLVYTTGLVTLGAAAGIKRAYKWFSSAGS